MVAEMWVESWSRHSISHFHHTLENSMYNVCWWPHRYIQINPFHTLTRIFLANHYVSIKYRKWFHSVWPVWPQLQEGPLDTVRRMEELMHNALRHVTKRPEAMSLDVKRNGLGLCFIYLTTHSPTRNESDFLWGLDRTNQVLEALGKKALNVMDLKERKRKF